MAIDFIPVRTKEEVETLAKIAYKVWNEHFITIISKEQIDYMVNKFQSVPAISEQIGTGGYEYFFINADGINVGYTGIHSESEEERLFLSKLYILKEFRKKGYASRTFEFLENLCKERRLKTIWLTVNRFNDDTVEVYKAKGFSIKKEQKADIGNGFYMDDFIMEYICNSSAMHS